jgi:hypothetical protein
MVNVVGIENENVEFDGLSGLGFNAALTPLGLAEKSLG